MHANCGRSRGLSLTCRAHMRTTLCATLVVSCTTMCALWRLRTPCHDKNLEMVSSPSPSFLHFLNSPKCSNFNTTAHFYSFFKHYKVRKILTLHWNTPKLSFYYKTHYLHVLKLDILSKIFQNNLIGHNLAYFTIELLK